MEARTGRWVRGVALVLCLLHVPDAVVGQVEHTDRDYRSVRIRSCPAADSLLGPLGNDAHGQVRALYDAIQRSSWVLAGPIPGAESPSDVQGHLFFYGHKPAETDRFLIVYFLRGRDAYPYLDGALAPQVRILLDDSAAVEPDAIHLGTYHGPREVVQLPLELALSHEAFLQTIRARSIELRIGETRHRVGGGSRTNLRALYRVVVCQTIE